MSQKEKALLKRFEPIVRYTKGEAFFPFDVERYVQNSSLWVHRPGLGAERILDEGELTLETLGEASSEPFGSVQYLKFIEPLNVTQLASLRLQGLSREKRAEAFHAGPGRLARVGYSSRILDAIFSLTLLARGRVPGDTAAAAGLSYAAMVEEEESYPYYGRVIEQDGWLVLQYWFFYPFNNWRSGFYGLNDHEGDWEMLCVYLYENKAGDWQPEWVAYAGHEFEGRDQRRRWDDPEVERVGEHAVVYAGAGSHAGYFQAGEYLAELVIPLLSPLVILAKRAAALWRRFLGEDQAARQDLEHLFKIPFVDYARGDGKSIGPDQDHEWAEPILISPEPSWVSDYRGLWGLWARDPVMGENAPGGPKFGRFGGVRQAWHDPIGWSALSAQSPPNRVAEKAEARQAELKKQAAETGKIVAEKNAELSMLGIEAEAMQNRAHLQKAFIRHQEKIAVLSREIDEMRMQMAADESLSDALEQYSEDVEQGRRGGGRSHLQRPQLPASSAGMRFSRIAEAWAAASIGLAMIAFVGIVFFAPQYLLSGVAAIVVVIAVIEATFRRRLNRLINVLSGLLAFAASIVLLIEFFWTILIVSILLAGSYILLQNLREVWR
jgi:hypothetical protein